MPSQVHYERYSANALKRFCEECFVKAGLSPDHARIVAEHLIAANLRGVDSHGVIRIPYYLEGLERGYVKPRSEIKILNETALSVLLDGGDLLGIIVATKATDLAIGKARSSKVSLVGARRLGHVGMLAYYTRKIAEEGFIGFACANCPPRVAPWGGAERIFGTNPISVGIPVNGGNPIVIDMATSAIAAFKINVALRQGKSIPPNSALTRDGKPTRDPREALEGVLLPFGGHKGYAIGLLVEVLSSAFIGGLMSWKTIDHASTQGGFLVAAVDPEVFRTREEYSSDIREIIKKVKSCRVAEGFSEILLPGEPEDRTYEVRLRDGIPLDPETVKALRGVARRLGIEFPRRMG